MKNPTDRDDLLSRLALGLRAHRIIQGFTQTTLSEVSSVGLGTICRIEQRSTSSAVGLGTLDKLARAPHCTVKDLIDYESAVRYMPGKSKKTRHFSKRKK